MKNDKILSIKEYRKLKVELAEKVYQLDDYIFNAYHKDLERFFILIERLNNTNLNLLSNKEVVALAFINQIRKIDIEFMKKEL